MKKVLLIGMVWAVMAGGTLKAQQGPGSFLEICRFNFSSGSPYVEIYVSVDGTTIGYEREEDGRFQASVKVELTISKLVEADTLPMDSTSYNLGLAQGDRLKDTTVLSRRVMLRNSQKLALGPGRYVAKAVFSDNLFPESPKSTNYFEFSLEQLQTNVITFSDVKWLAGELPAPDRAKDDGWMDPRNLLIPFGTNANFINQDSIFFYIEFYNTDKVLSSNYFVRSRLMIDDRILYAYEQVQPKTPGNLRVLKEQFMIQDLRSNIYYLVVEVVDQKNNVIASTTSRFFVWNSRLEPENNLLTSNNQQASIFAKYSEAELDYYLQTLQHISTEQERAFISALTSEEQKQNYLASFWEKRKKNPEQPIQALWQGHLAALQYCNQEFKSALRDGWKTDRGRVFFKYGIPSDIERFPGEAYIPPYEVWYYDRLGMQTGVKFIFFNKDIATDEYELLHSDKYGEVNNPNWRLQLTNRGRVPGNIDFESDYNNTRRYDTKLNIDD